MFCQRGPNLQVCVSDTAPRIFTCVLRLIKSGTFLFFVGYCDHQERLLWETRATLQKLHDDHSLTSGEYRRSVTNGVAKTGNCPSSQKPLGEIIALACRVRTKKNSLFLERGLCPKETELLGTFSVKMRGFSGTCFLRVGVGKNSSPPPFSIITAIKIKQKL